MQYYAFMAVLVVSAAVYCFAEWHLYKMSTFAETHSARNKRKEYLDICTHQAFALLYKHIYNTPYHDVRTFMWVGFQLPNASKTLVPNCRAIVNAKRQGVRVENIRVQRVMGKPYAVAFTLPDVAVRK